MNACRCVGLRISCPFMTSTYRCGGLRLKWTHVELRPKKIHVFTVGGAVGHGPLWEKGNFSGQRWEMFCRWWSQRGADEVSVSWQNQCGKKLWAPLFQQILGTSLKGTEQVPQITVPYPNRPHPNASHKPHMISYYSKP